MKAAAAASAAAAGHAVHLSVPRCRSSHRVWIGLDWRLVDPIGARVAVFLHQDRMFQ